jgi:urease
MLAIGQSRQVVLLGQRQKLILQVGSHYPFLETNPSLIFDRMLSYGTHLDIASGTAVRFEPGERKTVSLVEYGGKKLLSGGNGLGAGAFDESIRETKIKEMVEKHKFGHKKQDVVQEGTVAEMDREVVSAQLRLLAHP